MSIYLFIIYRAFSLWHSGKIDWFQQSCFQSSSLGWALNEHLSDKSQLLVLQIMFCLICSKANLACRKQSHQMCISQLPSGKLSVILCSQMSAFCNIPFENSDQGSPKNVTCSLSLLSAHWLDVSAFDYCKWSRTGMTHRFVYLCGMRRSVTVYIHL